MLNEGQDWMLRGPVTCDSVGYGLGLGSCDKQEQDPMRALQRTTNGVLMAAQQTQAKKGGHPLALRPVRVDWGGMTPWKARRWEE